MNRAPTLTVATATMAAAAVPTAVCAHRRLHVERPGLTVVIVSSKRLAASVYIPRLLDAGIVVVGASHQTV